MVTQKSSQVLSAKNMKGFEKGVESSGVKKNQWRHENCSAAIIAFLTLQLFLRFFSGEDRSRFPVNEGATDFFRKFELYRLKDSKPDPI